MLMAPVAPAILYHFQLLWPWLWDKMSAQSRTSWLYFLTFLLFSVKFCMVLKPFKLNILILTLSESLGSSGNNCYFTDSVWNFNVGLHSDIIKFIWRKCGMVIATTDLCALILVCMTLTLIQSSRCARKQNFCVSDVLMDFDENKYVFWTCLPDESHFQFI